MSKFIIKDRNGRDVSPQLMMEYPSKKDAYNAILEYAKNENKSLKEDINPIQLISSYKVEEIIEVFNHIDIFDEAKKALGDDMHYTSTTYDEIASLTDNINPKHIKALDALNELFTIAQAWNKEDNFIPDFSDDEQDKWAPRFMYSISDSMFVGGAVSNVSVFPLDICFGSRLCFKTKERAIQFGKQFVYLFNRVFM